MKFLKTPLLGLAFFILFFNCNVMNAQDLKKYQWEHRLILVFTDDSEDEVFENQLSALEAHQQGLDDRKLLVYQIKPKAYRVGLSTATEWERGSKLFSDYAIGADTFRIILIGLDGGKKLVQTKFLSPEKLFETIDAMPMRRAEMRKN